MKKTLTTALHKSICNSKLALKRHSPEILVIGGTIGVIASAILACRATLKAKDILDNTKDTLDVIHDVSEKIKSGELKEEYSDKDRQKDITVTYLSMGLSLAKLYSPAIILGGLSLTSILTSHNILRKRNAVLMTAYTAVDSGFKEYRKRVVDRFGEEIDKELKYGIKAQTFSETIKNEDGRETESKSTVKVIEPQSNIGLYSRYFDESSRCWTKSAEYNLTYLRAQEAYFNQKLISDGYVFLNDILNALDLPCSRVGQCVGWIYDPENPDHSGDNYIDFGIYNVNIPNTPDFLNGYTASVLLTFNVDGPIIDKAFKENEHV